MPGPAERKVTLNNLAGEALCVALDRQFFFLSTEEFNRFIGLLTAKLRCHLILVENLRVRFGWFQSLLGLGLSFNVVAEFVAPGKRARQNEH